MYAYNAELWCDSCGKKIIDELERLGYQDEGDTDGWPQYADEDQSWADSPSHCAGGEQCEHAEEIGGRMIGCLLLENLTDEGVNYVKEAIRKECNDTVAGLWADEFSDYLD